MLSDKKLRARYDAGDNIDDDTQQRTAKAKQHHFHVYPEYTQDGQVLNYTSLQPPVLLPTYYFTPTDTLVVC